MEVMNMTTG